MSPFSPAPCPLRSHRPQLSGREHSTPTLLNQRFSGIWCHSTPPPSSCQGKKSSSLAPAARRGGTDGPCSKRAAPQGPGGAQAARTKGRKKRPPDSHCAGSGKELLRTPPRAPPERACNWAGGGKGVYPKRLPEARRRNGAAKEVAVLWPPRHIGSALPLLRRSPPHPAPMRLGDHLQKMHRMGFFRRTAGLKIVEKDGVVSSCPICPTCQVHGRRGETVFPEPSAPCQHYAVPYALA